MDLGLNQAHVLVTGASGDIGFAITELFLDFVFSLRKPQEHGAYVTAQYNTKPGPLINAKAKASDRLAIVQADVTGENAVKELFEQAGRFFKQEVQVSGAVNHGIFPGEDIDLVDMDLSQWQRSVDINLTGSFLVGREFLRRLRQPRPSFEPDMSKVAVVVTGSTSGDFGEEGHIDYACTKSALQVGFIRTLKNEIVKIAPEGRVNAVSPGWVDTTMAEPLFANETLLKRTLAA
ncbi:hypothetical protein FRC07_014886 [Ceratobasidium sp. 392]|nr:hypothetical protein FRC07_014886 [Ceratobasidium sp. 392]